MVKDPSLTPPSVDLEDPFDAASEPEASLSETLANQVDENERAVYLIDDINPEMLRRIIPTLHHLDYESDDPITLHVSTPGGISQCMFALADCIGALVSPVNLIGYGEISSCGTVLLAVCAHRAIGSQCSVLLHGFSYDMEGSFSAYELRAQADQMETKARRWARLMAQRGGVALEPWLLSVALGEVDEVYLSAPTLVMMGWADTILDHPVRVPTGTAPDTSDTRPS